MMDLVFKLPPEFVAAHGEMLRWHDWTREPRLELAKALPSIPDLALVTLEAVSRGDSVVIRSATPKAMVRVRDYSDGLRKSAELEANRRNVSP